MESTTTVCCDSRNKIFVLFLQGVEIKAQSLLQPCGVGLLKHILFARIATGHYSCTLTAPCSAEIFQGKENYKREFLLRLI